VGAAQHDPLFFLIAANPAAVLLKKALRRRP
jgi:hypothetical protein